MSKMGRFVESQIEKGEFTVDQRGNYHVGYPAESGSQCSAPFTQDTEDTLRQDEGGKQCIDSTQGGE